MSERGDPDRHVGRLTLLTGHCPQLAVGYNTSSLTPRSLQAVLRGGQTEWPTSRADQEVALCVACGQRRNSLTVDENSGTGAAHRVTASLPDSPLRLAQDFFKLTVLTS